LAYQRGSVWPFDTSLIVSGFRRHRLDEPAMRLFEATVAAACRFPHGRLPEFIAGNRRVDGGSPVKALRSDPLQAWSAAALPFMVTELLGLEPDGFASRLTIRRPRLPPGTDWLRLEGLRLGDAVLSVTFRRDGDAVVVEADVRSGEAQIDVEE
ncbi:MAG: hypothetical protein ABI056_05460, partial [Caulobacteraceae bacterium]